MRLIYTILLSVGLWLTAPTGQLVFAQQANQGRPCDTLEGKQLDFLAWRMAA